MKKLGKWISFAGSYIVLCAFSMYDSENKFWFLALAAWISGMYFIARYVKTNSIKLINRLRECGSNRDYFGVFSSLFVAFFLAIVIFISGYQGTFYFNMGPNESESYMQYIFNSVVVNFALVLFLGILLIVLPYIPYAIICGTENKLFQIDFIDGVIFFLILSHFCGITNILDGTQFVFKFIQEIWHTVTG